MIETTLVLDLEETGMLEEGMYVSTRREIINLIGTEVGCIALGFEGGPQSEAQAVGDHDYEKGIVRVRAKFPSKVEAQAASDESQEFISSPAKLCAMLSRQVARIEAVKIKLENRECN